MFTIIFGVQELLSINNEKTSKGSVTYENIKAKK